MKAGLLRSAHDASDGGLAVALSESAFAGGFGAEVDLAAVPQAGVFRDDYLLFSESQSRFVVTVQEEDLERFEKLFKSVPHAKIGRVTEATRLKVRGIYGTDIIDCDIAQLKEAWLAPFTKLYG